MPGAESLVAVFDPPTRGYEPRPAKDGYNEGIEPLMDAASDDAFALIDLTSPRPVVGKDRGDLDDALFRAIHGSEMLLVMSGSTPAGELVRDWERRAGGGYSPRYFSSDL